MNLPDLRAAHRTGDHARVVQAFPGLLDEAERLRGEAAALRDANARLAAENRVLKANALVALDEAGDDVPGAYLRGHE